MRNWVKCELMELGALMESISRKEGVEGSRNKAQSKIREKKETIDKINSGKFTFAGMFKSAGEKAQKVQTLMREISEHENDIKNYEIIRNYQIVYLAEIALPAFKS
jgi:hypothetical protein